MGIHPEFSSFDRAAAGLDEARRALWGWAEPIVIDRAAGSYARAIDEAGTAAMARKQGRLWRMVLLDHPAAVRAARDDLCRAAGRLGLLDAMVDETDDLILEELVDIVARRYRSSRNALRSAGRVLTAAAACLETARHRV